MRRAGRKDKNQNSIVAALKAAGCSVFDTSSLGNGVPDLIVSSPGGWVLMEVKNPENSYGKHGLNENQVKWASEWKGGDVHVVRTIEDALALVVPTAEEALEVMGR